MLLGCFSTQNTYLSHLIFFRLSFRFCRLFIIFCPRPVSLSSLSRQTDGERGQPNTRGQSTRRARAPRHSAARHVSHVTCTARRVSYNSCGGVAHPRPPARRSADTDATSDNLESRHSTHESESHTRTHTVQTHSTDTPTVQSHRHTQKQHSRSILDTMHEITDSHCAGPLSPPRCTRARPWVIPGSCTRQLIQLQEWQLVPFHALGVRASGAYMLARTERCGPLARANSERERARAREGERASERRERERER
jgi:hypothetical protein